MFSAAVSGPPFAIPERSSSKATYEQRLAQHKQSREDLKRKLSDVSLERGSIAHKKLRISELELDVDEQRIYQTWLDMEKEKGLLFDKDYRKAYNVVNKRIISVGDELWQLVRKLREEQENAGEVKLLLPDSDGAFVAALLRLYKDPTTSRKRSSTQQSAMRKDAIQLYGSGLGAPEGELWCPINKHYYTAQFMKAAHIVPASLGPELADYVFGTGSGSRLFRADNCLILHPFAKRAFDAGNFVVVPVDSTEKPIRRWKVRLVNSAARSMDIGTHKLFELDDKELEFKTSFRPAARFFYYHFVLTLLRNRRYRQPGWETSWEELRTKQPWATPGPYLRKSMLLALARQADDVAESDVETLFVEPGTFDGEGLSKREEDEISKRALRAQRKVRVDHEEEVDNLVGDEESSNCSDEEEDTNDDEDDNDED